MNMTNHLTETNQDVIILTPPNIDVARLAIYSITYATKFESHDYSKFT